MPAPSEPLLKVLRDALVKRGRTVADLASESAIDRTRLRRVLKGTEPLTVDELIALSNALQLEASEVAGASMMEAMENAALAVAPAVVPPSGPAVDPWGNHVEQLFRVGFGLGCDFFFLADVAQLDDSGVPEPVRARYRGKELPIKLDAAYHRYNEPTYAEGAITITLSFDTLRACTFPWSAVRQVVFFPAAVEAATEPVRPAGKPFLRLVE